MCMLLWVIFASLSVVGLAQESDDSDIARSLSKKETRETAIDLIEASPDNKLSVLLSWIVKAPADVDRLELYIGLADTFGRMRLKEAIPFLVKYICIPRTPDRPNIWLKSQEAIEQQLPAVGALVRIGSEASNFLIGVPWDERPRAERMAGVFVVARIGDSRARAFLIEALRQPKPERDFAAEGLERIRRANAKR